MSIIFSIISGISLAFATLLIVLLIKNLTHHYKYLEEDMRKKEMNKLDKKEFEK